MRPLMYSEKLAELTQTGWKRVGDGIRYYRTQWNNHTQFSNHESVQTDWHSTTQLQRGLAHSTHASGTWYSLTWTFQFPHDDDVVYFASCYPYTYSQLQDYLTAVRLDPYRNRVCQQTQLCTTMAGNPVPLLTITEPERRVKSAMAGKSTDELEQADEDPVARDTTVPGRKQCVVITARVHPGETQSSWMIQGLLDFLLSKYPDAEVGDV
ncbi:unnamed protein product [Echinostoma caproni]|uniref:Peptidase_M14 domain-containing protein n=1 Tax=Echinostoma caproni TaxID=27848 RepID=A0A183AGS1_9TREM|nr:unnamed protein product [Echinostoma caproni]